MTDHDFAAALNPDTPYLNRYAHQALRGREDIGDLIQQTLERAWRNRVFYNPARSSVGTWLVCLFRNIVKDQFRMDRARHESVTVLSIDDLLTLNWDTDNQDDTLVFVPDYDTRIGLEQALIELGGIHEQVVRMCFIGGFTFAEVADVLQITRRKVRRILETGLKRLKRILLHEEIQHGRQAPSAQEEESSDSETSEDRASSEGSYGLPLAKESDTRV